MDRSYLRVIRAMRLVLKIAYRHGGSQTKRQDSGKLQQAGLLLVPGDRLLLVNLKFGRHVQDVQHA